MVPQGLPRIPRRPSTDHLRTLQFPRIPWKSQAAPRNRPETPRAQGTPHGPLGPSHDPPRDPQGVTIERPDTPRRPPPGTLRDPQRTLLEPAGSSMTSEGFPGPPQRCSRYHHCAVNTSATESSRTPRDAPGGTSKLCEPWGISILYWGNFDLQTCCLLLCYSQTGGLPPLRRQHVPNWKPILTQYEFNIQTNLEFTWLVLMGWCACII